MDPQAACQDKPFGYKTDTTARNLLNEDPHRNQQWVGGFHDPANNNNNEQRSLDVVDRGRRFSRESHVGGRR